MSLAPRLARLKPSHEGGRANLSFSKVIRVGPVRRFDKNLNKLYATVMIVASVRLVAQTVILTARWQLNKWTEGVSMRFIRPTVLVMGIVLLAYGSAPAQRAGPQFRRPLACEPLEPRTKLEALEWRYESVLIKGFSQIATLNARGADIRVDAIELKDVGAATRALGIVIALRETDDTPRENRAFIDYDEIDRLLRALDSIARVNETVTKLAGFEARYRTLGDLEIVVFRQARSGTAASFSAGLCDRVTGLITLDDLDRLKAHIVEAKTRLDEIK